MASPPPPDEPTDPPPLREAIARRLQARFESFDDDGLDVPVPALPGSAPDLTAARPAAPVPSPGGGRTGSLQAQFGALNQQLAVLRDQLDHAFDDMEDRLDDLEARLHLSETRASVAEARASVAESRAADAEARATGAHRRIDEILALFEQIYPRRPMSLEDAPEAGALERLRQLTRQANADS